METPAFLSSSGKKRLSSTGRNSRSLRPRFRQQRQALATERVWCFVSPERTPVEHCHGLLGRSVRTQEHHALDPSARSPAPSESLCRPSSHFIRDLFSYCCTRFPYVLSACNSLFPRSLRSPRLGAVQLHEPQEAFHEVTGSRVSTLSINRFNTQTTAQHTLRRAHSSRHHQRIPRSAS